MEGAGQKGSKPRWLQAGHLPMPNIPQMIQVLTSHTWEDKPKIRIGSENEEGNVLIAKVRIAADLTEK